MKNNLPPIALQLSHPDATFYSVVLDGDKITGLFAAHDNDQCFEISFDAFLESCYKCSIISDYADGQISIPGDRTDRNARQWAEFWLVETAGTKDFFNVLSDAVTSELSEELSGILSEIERATPASIVERVFRRNDTAFCDAVLKLAGIIEAVEAYQEEVEAANAHTNLDAELEERLADSIESSINYDRF